MNIQIFGKTKCFATKSADRFFKERKIKYQFIDINEKGMSHKELESVISYLGDINLIINSKSALYKELQIDKMRSGEGKLKCLIANPKLLVTPIVRDCDTRKATVGDSQTEWKQWINSIN